jgi:8-oxo-dGTP pyrophosphatase MutT (NUDIX family)
MSYAGAGLILLSSDLTHVLLVNDTRSGKWGFTKGHREHSDDSDLHTAVREVYEETGLSTDDYIVYDESFKLNKGGQSYIFRYATLKPGVNMYKLRPGPAFEVAELKWMPLIALVTASELVDGNKYLRTWINDIRCGASKKDVHLFRALSARLIPTNEPVSASNVVTCS